MYPLLRSVDLSEEMSIPGKWCYSFHCSLPNRIHDVHHAMHLNVYMLKLSISWEHNLLYHNPPKREADIYTNCSD